MGPPDTVADIGIAPTDPVLLTAAGKITLCLPSLLLLAIVVSIQCQPKGRRLIEFDGAIREMNHYSSSLTRATVASSDGFNPRSLPS